MKSSRQLSSGTRDILLLLTMFVIPAISFIGIVANKEAFRQSTAEIIFGFFILAVIFFITSLSYDSGACTGSPLIGTIFLISDVILAILLFIQYPILIFLFILFLDLYAFFMLMDC